MTVAEVQLWGRAIGAVSWDAEAQLAHFEYQPDFVKSGIQVSPITMPLDRKIYAFPGLPRDTFLGLPGMLADSLPDDFGNALIDAWLARQGRTRESFNPVERLCYTGVRGMGALEYLPAIGPGAGQSEQVDVSALVELASEILTNRRHLSASFDVPARQRSLQQILKVGTSAGGARAKAVVAWNPQTNEVRSGQMDTDAGFSHWILKFDGVSGNRDKELEDPAGYGLIEYAYYRMAVAAGIHMNECRLLSENGRSHFMTLRFDRTTDGQKIHMQSLAALGHFDYRKPGSCSYEQAFEVLQRLGLPKDAVEEQFRRMAFNIVGRNQDDHVKNIAFLMDKSGEWSLSPAFDVTYSYNPDGQWTSQHQMSLNGKRGQFSIEDFEACAKTAAMKRGRAREILAEVQEAVQRWSEFAEQAGVPAGLSVRIERAQRTGIL